MEAEGVDLPKSRLLKSADNAVDFDLLLNRVRPFNEPLNFKINLVYWLSEATLYSDM